MMVQMCPGYRSVETTLTSAGWRCDRCGYVAPMSAADHARRMLDAVRETTQVISIIPCTPDVRTPLDVTARPRPPAAVELAQAAAAVRARVVDALAAEIGDRPTAERLAGVVMRALEA